MEFSLRNVLAFFFACGIILSGAVKRNTKKALKGNMILSIYCHTPSILFLKSCIKWLQKKGFHFISVEELTAVARGEKAFPKGAVVLTVDDGWRNNKESIVTIVKEFKVPVTIFATTEPIATGNAYWWTYIAKANKSGLITQSVEALKRVRNEDRVRIVEEVKDKLALQREALTIDELVEISKNEYISIGGHTATHPILINCTDEKAAYEIGESKNILEAWLSKKIVSFSYPNGDYSKREINLVKAMGYQIAFTTQTHYITPESISDIYTIPREHISENISFAENICRITGAWINKEALFNLKGIKINYRNKNEQKKVCIPAQKNY